MSEGTNQVGNPFEGTKSESSDTFFNALDGELNIDKEVTPLPKSEQATSQSVIPDENTDNKQGNENAESNINWKKRYDDSTKNFRKQKAQLDKLQPFESIIDFLKEDSGAIDHLKSYVQQGGEIPKPVREQLNLGEDFTFDTDDIDNADTDTGKLVQHLVDTRVQKGVSQMLQSERQKAMQMQQQQAQMQQRQDFMKRMGYNEEQMQDLESRAKNTPMTYDTMHMVLNQDQVRQNIQKSTQQDIQNQMQNVRNIPTSIGGTNNAGQGMTSEEQMYNTIFGGLQNDENPF